MTTYIWNTEYMVYVANAKDLAGARALLLRHFSNQSCENIINEEDKKKLADNCVPAYVYNRACSVFRSDVKDFVQVFSREPDLVIDEYRAAIYTHSNE